MIYRNNSLITANKRLEPLTRSAERLRELTRAAENLFCGMGKLLDTSGVISGQQIDRALKPIQPATMFDAWKRIGETLNTSIKIEAAELSTENLRKLVKQLEKDVEKLSDGQKAFSEKNQQK